jgi:hypothetical protein
LHLRFTDAYFARFEEMMQLCRDHFEKKRDIRVRVFRYSPHFAALISSNRSWSQRYIEIFADEDNVTACCPRILTEFY